MPFFTSLSHVTWNDQAKAQSDHASREAQYGPGPFRVRATRFPYPSGQSQKVYIKVPRPGEKTKIVEIDGQLLVDVHSPLECTCSLRRA